MTAAVHCSGLGKCYRRYDRPQDRLVHGVRSRLGLAGAPASAPREFWALRDVSLDVAAGETVAVVGTNGSGKSTLLQIVAGTITPTSGSVTTAGRVSALLELGAGFSPEFSGLENVRMNAAVLGLDADAIEDRLDDILSFADIGDCIDQPVRTYSSGMFVRLAFAVAIHVDPRVLVIDEALAVGDIGFQAKCMLRIRRLQDAGTSILFVSHDLGAVRSLASRALYLEKGRCRMVGAAPAVLDLFVRDVQQALEPVLPVPATPALPPQAEPVAVPESLSERFRAFDVALGAEHGTGAARIRLVDMVDAAGRPVLLAEFDTPVTVRIWVQCLQACAVSVNYKIRNRQLASVAGADFLIAGREVLSMVPGNVYLVKYETRLALMDGDHTLRVSVTVPIDRHERAEFVHVVEVTWPFTVLPAKQGKIYTHVYLPNSVSVETVVAVDS